MPCGCGPVVDPALADTDDALNEFWARYLAVLNDHDHAGVEVLLRLVDRRQPRAFGGNHILNRDCGSIGFVDGVAVGVVAHWDQFSQYEEVRHFGGRDEAHQVKIEI